MLTFLISWLCVYRLLSILQYHRLLEPVLDYLLLPFYLKVDLVIVEPASCQGRTEEKEAIHRASIIASIGTGR